MKENKPPRVHRRKTAHAPRMTTGIWNETPAPENPYLTETCRCRGYDLHDLMEKRSFADTLYLLFMGELPTRERAGLLEALMIALINPGPRHPATRAAVNAGVGKTHRAQILPVALSVIGGTRLGGGEVAEAMKFLAGNRERDPRSLLSELPDPPACPGDRRIAPGFGSRFNGIEPLQAATAKKLLALPGSGPFLAWGNDFAERLAPLKMGWLLTGIAAAAFMDLGFPQKAGEGLFQLLCAPGLLAHGLEYSGKPVHALPFPDDAHYTIEPPRPEDISHEGVRHED